MKARAATPKRPSAKQQCEWAVCDLALKLFVIELCDSPKDMHFVTTAEVRHALELAYKRGRQDGVRATTARKAAAKKGRRA